MVSAKVNRRIQGLPRGGAIAAFLFMMTLGLSVTPAYSQYSCPASAGVAVWAISGSGNWDVAGNWNPSTGAPNSSIVSVCILNATPTTVTLNTFQLATMDNLTLNAPDTVSVSGLEVGLTVYGISIANAGNIVINGARAFLI